jgi:hypothetical protein
MPPTNAKRQPDTLAQQARSRNCEPRAEGDLSRTRLRISRLGRTHRRSRAVARQVEGFPRHLDRSESRARCPSAASEVAVKWNVLILRTRYISENASNITIGLSEEAENVPRDRDQARKI